MLFILRLLVKMCMKTKWHEFKCILMEHEWQYMNSHHRICTRCEKHEYAEIIQHYKKKWKKP